MYSSNPFLPANTRDYREWRARKLADYPADITALTVAVEDLRQPTAAEQAALVAACRRANFAVFTTDPARVDKATLKTFGEACGLRALDVNLYADDDGISALQVSDVERKREYIPYTNQRLNWHTDGYYNSPDRRIRAFLLFCARVAAEGGENQLLDHEMAYLLLRDADPGYIEALMHPAAMTIPANIEQGVEIRAAETGPVFSLDSGAGNLHMRYSARTRNIEWRDDPLTRDAVQFLINLWENGCDFVYHHRLMPGQGIICNNILHNRTAFRDDPANGLSRLMYRARYHDRVAGTDIETRGPDAAAQL